MNRLSSLSLLLIPFLLVLSGCYPDAPSYRIIVKNPHFLFCVATISVVACILGLFAPFLKKIILSNRSDMNSDRHPNNEKHQNIDYYDIQLFRLNQDKTKGAVCFHMRGGRPLLPGFFINGFSQDQFVDLALYWPTISGQRLEFFSTPVTTDETTVKFGDTLQQTETYYLAINTVFSSPA